MAQTWEDLLFAHWPVTTATIGAQIPEELDLDLHDGQAWLGVTPLRITGLRLRGTLPFPRLSSFLEVNVRTYVRAGERPGVWFFSLDASSRVAVEVAWLTYKLPYFHARISAERPGGRISFECARTREPGRAFSALYGATGDAFEPAPGSLEQFLTERYCLYTVDRGERLHRAEIHHVPWSLQEAEAEIALNTMPPSELAVEGEPVLHFSRRQDVLVWPLEEASN
jgi:uncharacterized protein YqjF (DUF2071 family)